MRVRGFLGRGKAFTAVLEKGNRALSWTIARVPFDAAADFGEMIRLRVRGTMNGLGSALRCLPHRRVGSTCW